jgi:hypothetical protein
MLSTTCRLLFGTRSLGVGCGRREELATPHEEEMVVACPELLLPAPATSPTYCCLPQLLHAAADDLPDLQLPFEVHLLHLFLLKLVFFPVKFDCA